jgi:hypothetical protein
MAYYISRMYPYFEVVVGLAWSYDPESYAGGSVAAGRVSYAEQVKGDDLDKKGYPGPTGWALRVGLTASPSKKALTVEKPLNIAESNRKRGQGSSWTVAPEEEEEEAEGLLQTTAEQQISFKFPEINVRIWFL